MAETQIDSKVFLALKRPKYVTEMTDFRFNCFRMTKCALYLFPELTCVCNLRITNPGVTQSLCRFGSLNFEVQIILTF